MSDQSKKQLTFFAQTSINQLTQHTCIHSQCVLFNLFTFASHDGQHMLIGTSISICMCFFCSVQAENIISEFQCRVSMLQINNILWSMLLHCVYAGSVCELDSVCVRFFPWALQMPYVLRFNGMRFRKKVKMHIAHKQQFHFRMSCTDVSILFLFSVPLSGCTVVRVFILPTHVA